MSWSGRGNSGLRAEAPEGPRSVIIILPRALRAERNYENEKTYETARVAVFANYRGDTPMHELVPLIAARMWEGWNESKAMSPEDLLEHAHNMDNNGCFNEWFGADMESKGEDDEAVVERSFEVLAGACTVRPNPDPTSNPEIVNQTANGRQGCERHDHQGVP